MVQMNPTVVSILENSFTNPSLSNWQCRGNDRCVMLFLSAAQKIQCRSDQFDCYKNGSLCIEATKLCDNRMDCANFADEDNELCACKTSIFISLDRYFYFSSTFIHRLTFSQCLFLLLIALSYGFYFLKILKTEFDK
jgi:hypothetical protein